MRLTRFDLANLTDRVERLEENLNRILKDLRSCKSDSVLPAPRQIPTHTLTYKWGNSAPVTIKEPVESGLYNYSVPDIISYLMSLQDIECMFTMDDVTIKIPNSILGQS